MPWPTHHVVWTAVVSGPNQIDRAALDLAPAAILMTTAAMIFGMLPVAIGHGDGGEIRSAMGVIVIGGLITSTLLTLVVVPVIYTFIDAVTTRVLDGFRRPASASSLPHAAPAPHRASA